MKNAAILSQLRRAAALLELHEANPFKIRSYHNAIQALESLETPIVALSEADLVQVAGVGKSIAQKVRTLAETGSFGDLRELLSQTPPGLIGLLDVKGLGVKKVRTLWRELGVEDAAALLLACEQNQVAALKGFGEKTQENIRQALTFAAENAGKVHLSTADALAEALRGYLADRFDSVAVSGAVRRRSEVVDTVSLLVGTDDPDVLHAALEGYPDAQETPDRSGPYAWRGVNPPTNARVEVRCCPPERFGGELLIHSAADAHLALPTPTGTPLLPTARREAFATEAAVYERVQWPTCPPELREGEIEKDWLSTPQPAPLLTGADLRGVLHCHSTYSDGRATLREMAERCRDAGYEYLGITDHSQAAFYANGLRPDRVRAQHREIDALNEEMAPFRIFKGIEADILADGALDYDEATRASFEFVVASVHTPLNMTQEKATERLLRAIANPHTTILGHPTGRLLLRREGYPLDHRAVIDACATHGVVVEINANPWRLDLDWRWVPYARERGVLISINPDAHSVAGYADMTFGVSMGRKGGLTASGTFNALGREAVAAHFAQRRA